MCIYTNEPNWVCHQLSFHGGTMIPSEPGRKVWLLYVLAMIVSIKATVLNQQQRRSSVGNNQRTGTGSVDVDAILNKVMMDFVQQLKQTTTTTQIPTTFGKRILRPAPPTGQFLQDNSARNTGPNRQRLNKGQRNAFYQNVSSTALPALLFTGEQLSTTTTTDITTMAHTLSSAHYLPRNNSNGINVTPRNLGTVEIYRGGSLGITTSHPVGENRTMGGKLTSALLAKMATTATIASTPSSANETTWGNVGTTEATSTAVTTSRTATVTTPKETSVKTSSNSTPNDWSVKGTTEATTLVSSKIVSTNFRNLDSRIQSSVPQKTATVSPKPVRLPVLTLSHSRSTTQTTSTSTSLPTTVSEPAPVLSKGGTEPKNGSTRIGMFHDFQKVLLCVPVLGLYLL